MKKISPFVFVFVFALSGCTVNQTSPTTSPDPSAPVINNEVSLPETPTIEENTQPEIPDTPENIQEINASVEIEETVSTETLSDTNTKSTLLYAPLSESSSIDDFKGKPSVIVFGGTYCPHCKNAVPVFKELIWDPYHNQANIWVNVIDQKRFDVEEINQGFNPNLVFNDIASTPCPYVPSWIVLDAEFNPVLTSCGSEKTMEAMEQALLNLF